MLLLLHGRGASEHDLLPLADALDPGRRLVAVLPRAPLRLPPGGNHWYVVREMGWPDPDTFLPTLAAAGDWVDAAAAAHGVEPDRVVLAGFSQGCGHVARARARRGPAAAGGNHRPVGVRPHTSPGFELDLAGRTGLPVAIGHGTLDQVIPVEWGRQAPRRCSRARGWRFATVRRSWATASTPSTWTSSPAGSPRSFPTADIIVGATTTAGSHDAQPIGRRVGAAERGRAGLLAGVPARARGARA